MIRILSFLGPKIVSLLKLIFSKLNFQPTDCYAQGTDGRTGAPSDGGACSVASGAWLGQPQWSSGTRNMVTWHTPCRGVGSVLKDF